MTDPLAIAAIAAAATTVIAAGTTAVVSIITALRVGRVQETVQKVETNTNSMSERLEKAAHLAGQMQGTTEERAKADGIAAAKAAGRAAQKNGD